MVSKYLLVDGVHINKFSRITIEQNFLESLSKAGDLSIKLGGKNFLSYGINIPILLIISCSYSYLFT